MREHTERTSTAATGSSATVKKPAIRRLAVSMVPPLIATIRSSALRIHATTSTTSAFTRRTMRIAAMANSAMARRFAIRRWDVVDGTDPDCDDQIDCTDDSCDPREQRVCPTCRTTPSVMTGNLCTDDSCDPVEGCVYVPNDANVCDDGLFCNGVEDCLAGECVAGDNPCPGRWRGVHPRGVRREETDSCVTIPDDSQCYDGNPCTRDTCTPAGCVLCGHLRCLLPAPTAVV